MDLTEFSILVPSEHPEKSAPAAMQNAAEILQNYIFEATGIKLGITTNNSGHVIQYVYDEEYGTECFNISVEDGNVIMRVGYLRGALYATFSFLKNIVGYRFYVKNVTAIDSQESIKIDNGYSRTEGFNTSIKYREVYTFSMFRDTVGDPRAKQYALSTCALHHTGNQLSSWERTDEKWGYCNGRDRNHSLSLMGMKKARENASYYCLTAQSNIDATVNTLRTYLESEIRAPGVDINDAIKISLSIEDAFGWCACRTCTPIKREYGSNSATIAYYVNKINEQLRDEYPDITFWTLAYYDTLKAPNESIDWPDNLYVCVAPLAHCIRHDLSGDYCPDMDKTWIHNTTAVRDWQKVTKNVEVWFYQCNFYYCFVPNVNFGMLYDSMRYYADIGIAGLFCEDEDTTVGTTDITAYLLAELMWNPDITKEEYYDMMKQFCIDYYGSEELYELLIILEESTLTRNRCYHYSDIPSKVFDVEFIEEHYDRLLELLEIARNSAKDADMKFRIDRLSLSIYYTLSGLTYSDFYVNGTSETIEKYTKTYNVLFNLLIQYRGKYHSSIFPDNSLLVIPGTPDPSVNVFTWYTGVTGKDILKET